MKIKNYFVCAVLLSATVLGPAVASADHTVDHSLQQLRIQLASIQNALNFLFAARGGIPGKPVGSATTTEPAMPTQPATPIQSVQPAMPAQPALPEQPTQASQQAIPAQPTAPSIPALTPEQQQKAIQNVQEKIKSLLDTIDTLQQEQKKTTVPEVVGTRTPSDPPGLALTRSLSVGASGDDVKKLQGFLKNISGVYPEGLETGYFGPATEAAVKRFQERHNLEAIGVVGPKTRALLNEGVPGVMQKATPALSEGLLVRTFQRGASGNDVKDTQELLKRFPDIYPHGLATGFYGPATENAIKNLQEKLGLVVTGNIDEPTRKKINDLAAAVGRKQPPKISTVEPTKFSVATKVTLTGTGFVLESNSLFVRGKTILSNLISADGTTIVFSIPADIPCAIGAACPLKIVNSNGISNAKIIKLDGAAAPPTQEPPPEPAPEPTPVPPDADIKVNGADGPLAIAYNSAAIINWSSEYADSCSVFPTGWSGTSGTQSTGNLTSSQTYVLSCSGLGGSSSDSVTVDVSGPPPPPTLTSISPSIVTTGMRVTLIGANFTPTGNTVTFTGSFTEPNQIISGVASSDGLTLEFAIPSTMPCRPEVVSQCSVFVTNQNGKSNLLSFWLGQHIDQVTVNTPNGGEKLVQGLQTTVSAIGGKSEAFGGSVSISYALVEASATTASDPSALMVGWIQHDGSAFSWNAKKVCDFDNANAALPAPGTCWDIAPGTYKILAVGRDMVNILTIWDEASNTPGNVDVSDNSFMIVAPPQPAIGVVSPNGGESFKRGDTVMITWEAKTIASRSVNIRLYKAGVFAQVIAANVPQGTETGAFLYTWVIPSTLSVGSDYSIEISDATNSTTKDASDGAFRIASKESLQILSPNGGETTMRGFGIPLFWDYSGYSPASINVHLYKGGVLYRTLATGVKQAGFNGSSFLYLYSSRLPSGNYARYAEIPVPLDIAEGTDYTLEITDGADSSIHDASDASFRIVSITSPTTFRGRLIDALSGAPLPNVQFGGYSGGSNLDGTYYSVTLPRFTSDANGEFSYTTTTDDFVTKTRSRSILAGWPACNDVVTTHLYRYPDLPRAKTSAGYFSWIYQLPSAFDPYYSLTTSVIDFGNLTLWPASRYIITFSDIPSAFYLSFQKSDGTLTGGSGNTNYTAEHVLSDSIPLEINSRVRFVDQAGKEYISPFTRLSSDARCQITTLSFMDGTFQWEPYAIGFYLSASTATVGTSYQGVLKTQTSAYYYGTGNQGVAPFTWGLTYGSLPPGLSFDVQSGTISGIPTTIGIYKFGARVTDANGVRAARDLTITVK